MIEPSLPKANTVVNSWRNSMCIPQNKLLHQWLQTAT